VDWKTLGLTDYPIVIKQPMDLGTIKVGARACVWRNGCLSRRAPPPSFLPPQASSIANEISHDSLPPPSTHWAQTRLESGHYTKHQQVADDVRLVWDNCKNYNQASTLALTG
jgi:hypothetical protein